jgi:hypothetical protein
LGVVTVVALVGAIGAWIAAGVSIHHQNTVNTNAVPAELGSTFNGNNNNNNADEALQGDTEEDLEAASRGRSSRRSDSRILRDIDHDVDELQRLLRRHVRHDDDHRGNHHDRAKEEAERRDREFVRKLIKYPYVKLSQFNVVDPNRRMFNGATEAIPSNDTARIIPCILLEPATGPGFQPAVVNFVPPGVFNGSLASKGLPFVNSSRQWTTQHSYTDNTALTDAFPLVMMPDRSIYGDGVWRGERLVRAGFRVLTTYSHKVFAGACPSQAGFCTGAALSGRFAGDDLRSVKNALKSNSVPQLPWSRVARRPKNGMPAIGCQGISLGTNWCQVAAAGTKTLIAGSSPVQNQPDYDFQSIMSGDNLQSPNTAMNETTWNVSFGMWSSGQNANWNIWAASYNRLSLSIFYDLRGFDHQPANTGPVCQGECGRVFKEGTQTALDLAQCGGPPVNPPSVILAHCPASVLENLKFITTTPAATIKLIWDEVFPKAPTSGQTIGKFDDALFYHMATYFWHTLYDSPLALTLTTLPTMPDIVHTIYVNSTPGFPDASVFNLVGKTAQIDLSPGQTNNVASVYVTQGPIRVPPGSVGPQIGASWDDNQLDFNLTFNFPLKQGELVRRVNQTVLDSNGLIYMIGRRPVGTVYPYSPERQHRQLEDIGVPLLACFAGDLASSTVPGSGIFVLNTAQEFTVTWMNVTDLAWRYSLPGVGMRVSFQCSLYPNGTRTVRFDTNAPGIIPSPVANNSLGFNDMTSHSVGWTSGLLHTNQAANNNFQFWNDNKKRSWAQVIAGDNAAQADVILETYSGGFPAFSTAGSFSSASLSAASTDTIEDFVVSE